MYFKIKSSIHVYIFNSVRPTIKTLKKFRPDFGYQGNKVPEPKIDPNSDSAEFGDLKRRFGRTRHLSYESKSKFFECGFESDLI